MTRILLLNISQIIGNSRIRIDRTDTDYHKYGGKGMSVDPYMNFPFFARVTIVWKDNKYKVTVSNMEFHANRGKITGDEAFGIKKGIQFDTTKFSLRSGTYLEQYLSDMFRKRNLLIMTDRLQKLDV